MQRQRRLEIQGAVGAQLVGPQDAALVRVPRVQDGQGHDGVEQRLVVHGHDGHVVAPRAQHLGQETAGKRVAYFGREEVQQTQLAVPPGATFVEDGVGCAARRCRRRWQRRLRAGRCGLHGAPVVDAFYAVSCAAGLGELKLDGRGDGRERTHFGRASLHCGVSRCPKKGRMRTLTRRARHRAHPVRDLV